jgi:hypothetical protein
MSKIQHRLTGLFVVSTAAVLAGCATPTAPSSGPVVEVPSLKIVTGCGPCQVRAGVPERIQQAYRNAAAKAGMQVSSTDEATLTITGYADRDNVLRHMIGIFAGKDEIIAVVTHKDKKFTVQDYYRNAWLGVDTLAFKIGEMTFERIK